MGYSEKAMIAVLEIAGYVGSALDRKKASVTIERMLTEGTDEKDCVHYAHNEGYIRSDSDNGIHLTYKGFIELDTLIAKHDHTKREHARHGREKWHVALSFMSIFLAAGAFWFSVFHERTIIVTHPIRIEGTLGGVPISVVREQTVKAGTVFHKGNGHVNLLHNVPGTHESDSGETDSDASEADADVHKN